MKKNRQPLKVNVYLFGYWRITVMTSMLFRLEYDRKQLFEDRFSQIVVNRSFQEVACSFSVSAGVAHISSTDTELWIDGNTDQIHVKSPVNGTVWRLGEPLHNLGGTARTLDNADGPIPLEDGLFSEEGIGVLEDCSCLIDDSGEIFPRNPDTFDVYLFLYGRQFEGGLKDFYRLCGSTPLIPRYALGNWWSRFWPYTQQEYLDLMDRFEQERLPFSVAVLDMDWHLTRVPEGYSGWTGYTWNRDLIPDPENFLHELHNRGKHVTLNLHPADGVQPFEENYSHMAEAMGLSPDEDKTIPFDFVDNRFRAGYFDALLHPMEQEGVDFWWIDWQQGTETKIPGLDPLWLLNHFHFQDAAKGGKQPLILSRYAGPGSHRYPIGFSGDTVVSWRSLQFQPYYTATAANIGYGWWSHDIGGHMNGVKDDELACRWLQFGVFSPINRLHSTCNQFAGKEPWRYRQDIREIMGQFLQLRHRMIPYLHSMNYRSHLEGIPLIRPMYHGWPQESEAYRCPNQYEFGSQMIVAPVITPSDSSLGISVTDVWLPDGIYFDFFSGIRYHGGRWARTYRPLDAVPAFVKAGGIIPLTEQCDAEKPVECLIIRIYPEADGFFSLYEDDGKTEGQFSKTEITLQWSQRRLVISKAQNQQQLPIQRSYRICFCSTIVTEATVIIGSERYSLQAKYSEEWRGSVVTIPCSNIESEIRINFSLGSYINKDIRRKEVFALLQRAQIEFKLKEQLYSDLERTAFCCLPEVSDKVPEALGEAIQELLNQ